MISRNASRAFGSCLAGPRRVSMKPWIEASGVLISWLALATKSERIRSIITCSVCSRNASSRPWPRSPRSTGSIRALNCFARSWVGLKVTLLAAGPRQRAADRREHARGRAAPAPAAPGGSGAAKLRRAAALACRTTSSRSTTRIGSGSASMIVASIRRWATIRPDWRRSCRPSSATGPQQAARQRAFRHRRAVAAPARAAGSRSRRRWPRARAGARAPGTRRRRSSPAMPQRGQAADQPEDREPSQCQASWCAPDETLAQERTILAHRGG